jgi:ATP-dependent DNA helicase RecQ
VDTIFVSTIHKAKGREFDNVYLILNQFELQSDQAKRLLYVAMTRAKQNLTIHYNGSCFNSSNLENVENVEMIRDDNIYLPPKELGMQLGFKDVWLDFFLSTQSLIAQLNSGDELIALENCCLNSKGQVVLKFSKQFMSKIENIKQKNYVLKKAKIRFIVYWQKEDSEYEIRIILPEVYFEKLE